MTRTNYYLNDIPISITTYKTKVRHHKKRRIQKKWAKQQMIFELQPDGEVVLANGGYYMNENTFNIADISVKNNERKRYFLYGGTKRLRTLKNSFIVAIYKFILRKPA